jgi:molybdopterin molybdotransferase
MEEIPSAGALGRVTAAAVVSTEALPAFARSTVDGYAVRAADTYGASETLPSYLALTGEVPMGQAATLPLRAGEAQLIHTGGMLPAGADAVVMLEMTQSARPGEIEVLKAAAVGENILRAGEDVQAGAEVLPAGVRLRPAEIGGLMALGHMTVRVAAKPRVAILSSGDEVIPPQHTPRPGQVRDINSYALAALVESEGGEAILFGILPDERAALQSAVSRALAECDAVIITAGSSASTRDLTAEVIHSLGEPGVLVHGVNVKPGKPTILGVCAGKAVIGLPGNPVSALVIAGIFVTPVIEHLLGLRGARPRAALSARLVVNLASQAGREDWVPVRLLQAAHGLAADPIFYKSNLIFSLARADGMVHIPADANGLAAGEMVQVELFG